jgi:hypothetical protein
MNLLSKTITPVFILFWMSFLFIDYWQKHPVYYYSFKHFSHWGLSIFLVAMGAGFVWGLRKFGRKKQPAPLFNGLGLFVLFLLTGVVSAGFAYGQVVENASFELRKAFHILGLTGGTALSVLLITLVSNILGNLICGALRLNLRETDAPVVQIATGIMALVMGLFLLGATSMLHAFVLFPLFVLVILLRWKTGLNFLKKTFWQPIAIDNQLNTWGAAAFFGLVTLYSINFVAVNVPMPAGFDALTLYANLPALVGEHHALVEGFQPYNWSLLMSLGHILFNSTEASLALSWLGSALSAFAMYALCRTWLKLDVNFTFLAILVFSLTPSMTIQSSAELKVDLGLLFIYLTILLVLLSYFSLNGKTAQVATWLPVAPEVLLIGLLTGFAMGIKLTTAYFAIALVCALWYKKCGKRGFFAAFLAGLFLVFLLRLDDISGLRQYHIGVIKLQWGALLAGLLLLVGVWLENKEGLLKTLRSTAFYGAFLLLPFLPWMAKNFAETKSLAPYLLLNGKQASPDISLQKLEHNQHTNGN